jgi:DUF1009 family protein
MDKFNERRSMSNVGFWKTRYSPESGDFYATLDVDAVVRNAIANMRRLEEETTLKVVIDYLRSVGYTVIEPVKEES